MSHGIVIIGSGFAARQLVKNIRKQDATVPLTLIAADSMDEYNKPDLSHVISQSQRAEDLTRQTGGSLPNSVTFACFRIPGSPVSTPPHTWSNPGTSSGSTTNWCWQPAPRPLSRPLTGGR